MAKRSIRNHKRRHRYTKKQAGGFRYGNLRSGDVLVSASDEPRSRTKTRTRTRTRTRTNKKSYKKWF